MSAERPDTWMPMFWADYFADTGDLSAIEHGAYLLLIGHYWRKGPLPDDDTRLMRIARCTSAEWRRVRPIVAAFFRVVDGVWRHKRVDHEWERAIANRDQRAAAGRASAEARARQRDGNARSTDAATEPPTNLPTEGQRNGQQKGNSSSSSSPPSSLKEANASSGVARSERQPATHLPRDWKPDQRQRDYAAKLGLQAADIEREVVKFTGYFGDGKGANERRNDRGWRQSWQRWCGTAAKNLPPAPRPGGDAHPPGSPEWYAAHPEARKPW